MLKERKSKIKVDINYETDIEKVEAFKQLERERERYERLERNQVRINAIKNIYEAKMKPKEYIPGSERELAETDNEVVLPNQKLTTNNLHNKSMPKLNKPDRNKTKSFAFAQSQKKLPKNTSGKEEESEF